MSLPARLLGGLLNRLLAVALTLAAIQMPVYYAQYLQLLSGVRLEAESRYLELRNEAQRLGVDLEAFIARHELNPDPVFQASGRIHRSTLRRFERADQAWRALTAADPLRKPLALYRHFDPELHAALRFSPGLPLNAEAAGWGLAGLLLASLLSGVAAALLPGRRTAPA